MVYIEFASLDLVIVTLQMIHNTNILYYIQLIDMIKFTTDKKIHSTTILFY